MKLMALVLNFLFLVCLTGAALWAWTVGSVAGGYFLVALAISIVPFGLCVAIYFAMRENDMARTPHLVLLAGLGIALVPLVSQPWNPRNVFIAKLLSIQPGMTEADARLVMKGYLGGVKGDTGNERYLPDAIRGKGVTHILYYRWNDVDGRYNADVGHVYLKGETVVGRDFSPD